MAEERKSTGRLISILYRQAIVYFHKRLEPFGLGHGQMPVLMHIYHHDGVTQHDLKNHFFLDKGSISSTIKNLETRGYIFRKSDEADKRVHRLHISEKTRQLMPRFGAIFQKWSDVLLKDFSEEEANQAYDLLSRMIENTQQYFEGEGGNE
mgnify:CR=1 FL=1